MLDSPPRIKRLLAVVVSFGLTFALGTLTALAYATPPDQTWMGGLYDNADHDDVVLLATSESATEADSFAPGFELLRIIAVILAGPGTSSISDPGPGVAAPRGPPSS